MNTRLFQTANIPEDLRKVGLTWTLLAEIWQAAFDFGKPYTLEGLKRLTKGKVDPQTGNGSELTITVSDQVIDTGNMSVTIIGRDGSTSAGTFVFQSTEPNSHHTVFCWDKAITPKYAREQLRQHFRSNFNRLTEPQE